ncbi:hypothetical protein F4860DRAFT_522539 [Xylaria cubensis]|nr:hypothetical protein F4860DRAFT_522539 [Xylaria cubensis]
MIDSVQLRRQTVLNWQIRMQDLLTTSDSPMHIPLAEVDFSNGHHFDDDTYKIHAIDDGGLDLRRRGDNTGPNRSRIAFWRPSDILNTLTMEGPDERPVPRSDPDYINPHALTPLVILNLTSSGLKASQTALRVHVFHNEYKQTNNALINNRLTPIEIRYQPHVGLEKVFPRDGEIDETTVDIIAIHGLDTDSPRTWTYKKGDSEINWLERLLPADVKDARIYTYNWDAKVFNNAPVQTIFGHADRLLALIKANHGTLSRPILFIASCFGGLVLAEAIIRAAQEGSPYRQVLQSTIGIVFLATPFAGTDVAREASWLVVVKGIMGKDASGELIKDLEKSHDKIRGRVQEFSLIANSDSNRILLWFFYETKKTKIMKKILGAWVPDKLLRGSILVEENSACIPGSQRNGLGRTHVMMNKFENHQCLEYQQVIGAIRWIRGNAKPRSQIPIEQRDRLLASLKFTGLNEWKNNSREGTFSWIFHASDGPSEDDRASSDSGTCHTPTEASEDNFAYFKDRTWYSFEDWLRSKHNTYWISGKLGSGKTTLVKYLIENPLTMEALSVWAKDPVIISHFFWKAGPVKLQKNIKGCLCSILYQALEPDTVPLGTILATHKSLLTKTSDTDWSLKELRGLCLDVLKKYPSPVCIFLDGLDEICIEDRSDLLELVDDLRAIPNTKICLASRPEPHLESVLSEYPHLRLQDLTFRDMKNYASKTIQPYISKGRISLSVGSDITDRLTRKAEGVFLWLRLALNDLTNGLRSFDSDNELYARLEQMPADLNKLYEDIWTRINEDSAIHRKDAALYFKLAIASRNKNARELNLLHLMATTTDLVQRCFIDPMSAAYLEKECETTIRKIRQRCIGLLEIVPRSAFPYVKTRDPQYASLLPYWQIAVQFPHRTAYDFLTQSDEGNRILEFDSSTSHDASLRLLKSDLIMIKLIQQPSDDPGVDNTLGTLSRLTDLISDKDVYKVLEALRYLYDNGYYSITTPKPHFLAVAARLSFREFVLSNIASSPDPSLLATDVLRYKSTPRFNYFGDSEIPDFPHVLSGFWEQLLKLKADPSRKGICFPEEIRFGGGPVMPFRSPTGNFLFEIFQRGSGRIDEQLKQLRRFIEAEPNLQERIPFLIEDNHNGLYIGHELGESIFYSGDRDDPIVVLDLDLKFLVGAYFERARKRGMTSSTDGVPYRPPGETSSDTSIRIALVGFIGSHDSSSMDHYECLSNEATKQLLQLLVQFLYGDSSSDLVKRVRHELHKIRNDIRGQSSEYMEIKQKNLSIFFAERNLGYCFVNEAGVGDPDRADVDSEPDRATVEGRATDKCEVE